MKLESRLCHDSGTIISNSVCTVSRWTGIARIVDDLARRCPTIGRYTQLGLYSIGIPGLFKIAKARPFEIVLIVTSQKKSLIKWFLTSDSA